MNANENLEILDTSSLNDSFKNNTLSLQNKIDLFRKLNKVITYNEDLKASQIKGIFFLNALKDIDFTFNKGENQSENDLNEILYLKLYLMYLYNISNSESVYKKKLFNELFQIHENSRVFFSLIIRNIADIKVQKFVLGILHNLVFNQSSNLKELKRLVEFVGFFCVLIDSTLASYDTLHKSVQDNPQVEKDLNEINDWVHLIFGLIVKTDFEFDLTNNENEDLNIVKHSITNEKTNLFLILTDKEIVGDFYFIILEIMRDCVENSKSVDNEKYFLISKNNFESMLGLFLQNITILSATVKEFIETKNFEKINFYTFDKLSFSLHEEIKNKSANLSENLIERVKLFTYCEDPELRKILAFKEFICLVDIFSVFLVTEEYREFLFDLKLDFDFVENLYSLIKSTDFIYDDYFVRSKSLKDSEKINYDYVKLNENSVWFSFQTNVMKFLSNYAYKNEAFKEKLIGDPERFLALLNHMKIDNCNPFKKEWTILMLKSLCENNHKIQNLIKELRPQQIDPLLKDYVTSDKNNYEFPQEVQEQLMKNEQKE